MITHQGTQKIQTPRLILRRFCVEDAQMMYDNWASDPKVTRFLRWLPHSSVEVTKSILTDWVASYEKLNTYNWVITLNNIAIGSIAVVHFSERDECAELGYCLGYDYWGKGIMTEAVQAVVDYLFSAVGVFRIELSHTSGNPGSGKVAQKCHMTPEGIRRSCFKDATGCFHDLCNYGILRNEWSEYHNCKL